MKLNFNYENQLFILSEDVKNIQSYFSALYNNNNNKEHFNQQYFNYDELAQKIAVLTHKSQFYTLIKNMINTDEALRVITALLFKGFSWNNELLLHFQIDSNLYVNKTLVTLRKLDLLESVDGISLHPILFDSIKNSKSSDIRKSLHQAKIYFITPRYIKFCELLVSLIEFKVNNSSNFKSSLSSIIEHSRIFTIQYEKILHQEETFLLRTHKSDHGLIYETETLRSKQLKQSMKEAIAEIKIEKLEHKEREILLTNKEKSQLELYKKDKNVIMLIDDSFNSIGEFKKTGKCKTTYNGREDNEVEIMKELKRQDDEIDKSPLIKGTQNLKEIIPLNIFGEPINTLYLTERGREQFKEEKEDEKVSSFLDSLIVGDFEK